MSRRARWLIGFAAIAATVLVPAGAEASVASKNGNTLTVAAAAGEVNDVTVQAGLGGVSVRDTAGVTAGDGCAPYMFDPSRIDCPGETPDVVVVLGDGSDRLTLNVDGVGYIGAVTIDAGSGDDQLVLSAARETVSAGEGNDNIEARSGDDQLAGGPGDDVINGGSDSDTIEGGAGRDRLEGDCSGCFGPGNDTINSRDGEADTVSCWLGTDVVTADELDVIEGDGQCESVDIASGGGGLELGLAAKARGKIAKLVSRAGFRFRLAVSEPCNALVRLRVAKGEARKRGLGRRAVILGSDTAAIPEAGAYAATLPIKRKFRAEVRELAVLRTTLVFACESASGVEVVSKRVTFRG